MKSSTPQENIKKLIPVLSKQEKQEILAYYIVYEKYSKEFSQKATEDLKDHPVFGKFIRDIPKEVSRANDKLTKELQKDAIINDNWQPYIEYQIKQGIIYAKMGLDFKSWYEVVVLAKNYIRPYLYQEYKSDTELFSSLNGMNRFMDLAMGIIGEAYMQEKQEIIQKDQEKIKKLNDELEQKIKEITDYKYALDESSIIAITDQKGIIKEVNNNFCTISKYKREELIGQDHRIVNSGHHPKKFIRDMWVTIANGKIWRGELKNKAKDGSIYWVDTTIVPFLNELGKPYQYLAIRSERTQQKESEEKLMINEKQFRHTLDSMLEGIQIIGFDWRYIYVNDSMAKHGKYAKEEFIGHTVMEKYPGIEQTEIFKIYLKCFNERVQIHLENEFIFPDKSKGWFELSFQPVPEGIFILSIDITDRKKAQLEIQKLNEKLEQKVIKRTAELQDINKELNAFTYSVSHDLRAPLRAVNGYAEMLNEDYGTQLDEEGKRIIQTIRYNATKMGTLIDDLLAFSRLGRKEIQKTKIDMKELLEGVLLEMNKSISHHAEIKIGKLYSIKADYGLLHQVMFNLISNAVKYSSKKEKPVVELFSEDKNDEIIFTVKDNGVGFDMKYVDKLFGVFQRLHSQEEFNGTGVGLAIVQRIIAKHKGKIWANGKVNEGATFKFSLTKK